MIKKLLCFLILFISNHSFSANFFWIGGTGNWNDVAHWSATSGGAAGVILPTNVDNVIFDNNSGLASAANIVTMNVAVTVTDFDYSLVPNAFTFAGALASIEIRGSFASNGLANYTWLGDFRFNSTTAGNTITTNGQSFNHNFYFIGTETVEIIDDLNTLKSMFANQGGIVSNNNVISCLDFNANTVTAKTIDFDNTTINVSGVNWNIDPTAITWSSANSIINLNNTGAVNFLGGSVIYNNVISLSSNLNISNNNTFSLLSLAPLTTLTLANSSNQTLDSLIALGGNCTTSFIIQSSNPANPSASITKSGFPVLSASHLNINNVDAIAPSVYNVSLSDTTNGADGWTYAGATYYWVGDAGSWSDANHWSFSSGGPTAVCVPTYPDSVIFDALSFSAAGQEVLVDIDAYFSYMDWTNSTNNPTLMLDTNIYSGGDIIFNPDVFVTRTSIEHRIEFTGQADFDPNSAVIDCNISVLMNDENDGVVLNSDLLMTDSTSIYLLKGELYFQTNIVNTGSIQVFEGPGPIYDNKLLDLGGSTIDLFAGFNSQNVENFTFNGGTSNLSIGSLTETNYLLTDGIDFHNVSLDFQPLTSLQRLSGGNSYFKLKIAKGSHIQVDSVHTVLDSLIMLGNCRDSIYLFAANTANPSSINKATNTKVVAECIDFQDVNTDLAPLTALFSTGTNTNWILNPTLPVDAIGSAVGPYCFGDTTYFVNNTTAYSGDLNDVTSVWYFNDGTTGYYLNPPTDSTWVTYESDTNRHVFAVSGDIDVILHSTYSNYCVDTDTIPIYINSPSIQISSSDFDRIICAEDQVTFEASSSSSIAEFQFYLNGIAQTPQSANDTLYVTATLTHQDTVGVLSFENGCPSDTMPFYIMTVNPSPVFSWTSSDADTAICLNESVSFLANAADPTYTYQYLINGATQTGYTLAGSYVNGTLADNDVISLVGRTSLNCRDTLEMTFTVNPLPPTTLAESTGGNVICFGDQVTFTGTGASQYEFFIDGVSQGAASATNTWSTTALVTGDTVTVLGYSAFGCEKSAPEFFTYSVNSIPNVTLSTVSPTSICSGTSVTFSTSGASQYEFLINGVSVQGPAATNSFTTTGLSNQDSVSVIGGFNGCSQISDTIIFSVVAAPTTALVSDAVANTACTQNDVNFTASGATNYEFFVNGVSQGAPSTVNTFSSSSLTNGQTVSVEGESNTCVVSDAISLTILPIPAVNLFSNDADNIICDGQAITLTGANANQYELFIDGVSQGAPQASPTFVNPTLPVGSNQVYLIGTAINGCSDTSQAILNIVVNPIPTITLSSSDFDDIICNGDQVTFTGSGSTMYQFFVGGISQGSMSATNTLVTSNLINGQTVYINGSTAGCQSTSNTLTYTVNAVPTVSLASTDIDNVYCVDASVDYTANGATNYEFIVNGVSQGAASPTNVLNSSGFAVGSYSIQVLGEQNNCNNSASLNITVNGLPSPTLSSSDIDNTICSGESVTYSGTGGTLFEFFINGVSQGASSVFNSAIYNTLNDQDSISIIATSNQGCTNTASAPLITVNPTPTILLSSSDIDFIICAGDNVDFSGAGADEYEFFINGVSQGVASATNIISTAGLTNNATISIVGSSLGCEANSNTLTFTVNNYPIVNLINNGDIQICENENTNLIATGAANYQFSVNGTPTGPFGPTATFTNAVNNGDIVTVSGQNNGCTSSSPASYQFTVNTYPTLVSSSSDLDNIICVDDLITFNASGASTYLFELNGVSIQNGATTSYNTDELENTDLISITGFNGDCASTTDDYLFTVNEMTMDLTANPGNLICEGTSVTFTATGSDNYQFFLNGTPTGAMSTTNTFTSSTLTDLDEITFIGASNTTLCNQNYNDFITMSVIDEPVISANSSYTFCEGDSVVLISNAPYGNQWYLDGNIIAGATDTFYVAYNTGVYSLEVTGGGTGQVWSFGVNANGKFGNGNNINNSEPTTTLPIDPLDEISSGDKFVLSVTETGEVYAWGDNEFGQLGQGNFSNSNAPLLVPTLSDIKTVATSYYSSMAVTNSGDVYVWGENLLGQLATGNTAVINFPFQNTALTNIDTISGGKNHFIFLKNDGTVWATGSNISGQLGQGNFTSSLTAIQVLGLSNIVAIGTGEESSFAIDNTGQLYAWGNNVSGQLGLGDNTNRLFPTLSPLKNVISAQGGANHAAFINAEKELFTSGGNAFGQLGLGDNINRNKATKVDLIAEQVSTGQYTTLVRKPDNNVFGFGNNINNELSSPNGTTINAPEHISNLEGVTFVEAGKITSHVIFGQNQACVSNNVNTTMNAAPPVTISLSGNVLTATAGASYQWYFNGSIIPTGTNQTFVATAAGQYTVRVTFANGCVGTSSPLSYGFVGIDILSETELNVYPNPTNGLLNLAFKGGNTNNDLSILIFDQTGRQIRNVQTQLQENIQLDLIDLESGSYQAVILMDGFEKTIRFVKTSF